MLKEFKQFAMKGNVMDLAIGVVIGAAFQKIVSSLVEDIIMPCISMTTGKIDFSNMMFTVGDVSIKYGNFITAIVNFLIISFSIFLVVKYINKIHQPAKLKELNEKLVKKIDKKGKLQKILHKKLHLKILPKISFHEDTTGEEFDNLERILLSEE